MIQPGHSTLSIVRQCRLASISRSTFDHVPVGERHETETAHRRCRVRDVV